MCYTLLVPIDGCFLFATLTMAFWTCPFPFILILALVPCEVDVAMMYSM